MPTGYRGTPPYGGLAGTAGQVGADGSPGSLGKRRTIGLTSADQLLDPLVAVPAAQSREATVELGRPTGDREC